MTLPISLTGARAIFSIATLSRGRAPLAVCLSVFLLGFAALEIRAQEEPTRLDELVVSDGRVQFFFFSAGQCIQISNTSINGVTYTIHSSYWQRRSGAGSPWEEIPGTQETGQVCSLSPDSAGEYRLVADITIGDERGLYSSNILTKTGTDPEPAGLAPADQAAFDSLAVGKQILAPAVDGSLIFLSRGRLREIFQGDTYDGDYQYVNTGENMGTLTYTYDVTGNNPNVEKSVVEFTFTSATAGTLVHTHTESGSPPQTLRLSFEFVDAPVEPATVPRAPILDAAFSLDGAVEVRWLLVPDATSYDVRWKSGSQEYSDTLDDRLVNIPPPPPPETRELNVEIGDLMNGTEYVIQARAKNSAGDSDWSEEARVTPAATRPPAVEPKPPDEVQATVEAAVEAGGGLRAGGPPVTIDMSALFSFGEGVIGRTDYGAQSSDPALVAAETTDERLVLTPGNSLPAGASSSLAVGAADGDPARATITVTAVRAGEMAEVEFTVEVEAAAEPVPALPLLGQLLLALGLAGAGARRLVRSARRP